MWRMARWMILVIGVLLTAWVAVLPDTRWIVRTHLRMAWDPGAYGSLLDMESRFYDLTMGRFSEEILERIRQFAVQRPDDWCIQLAWSLMQQKDGSSLRQLLPRFGSQPAVLANILRTDSIETRFTRKEVQVLSGGLPGVSQAVSPTVLDEMERCAQLGEKADADNAFFTMMRSATLFAGYRDREAIEALFQASRKRRWDDYVHASVYCSAELLDHSLGKHSAIFPVVMWFDVLHSHLFNLNFCAKMAVHTALQLEKQGRIEEGIDIRLAILRCTRLVRLHGRSSLSVARAGGIARWAALLSPKDRQLLSSEDHLVARLWEKFARFLRQAGRADDAHWVEMEHRQWQEAQSVMRDVEALGRHPLIDIPVSLARGWLISVFLLTCVLAALLMWGIYSLVACFHLHQGRFVYWIGAVAVTAVALATWFSSWWRSVGMFWGFAYKIVQWLPQETRISRLPNEWLQALISKLSFALDSEVMALLLTFRVVHTAGVVLLLLFMTAALTLVAAVTGRGYAESIALGWRRHGTWLVGVLMALYAFSVLHTAQVERCATQELRLFFQNEMRYLEQMLKRKDANPPWSVR